MNYFNELFDDTNGLCHQIFTISDDRGKALFGDIDNTEKETIDGFFNFSIGGKVLAPNVLKIIETSADIDAARAKLARFFLIRFESSLLALKSTLSIEYNPLESNTEKIEKTIDNDTSKVNKIAGFDSSEMVDADGDETENDYHELTTKTSNNTNRSAQSLINEKIAGDKENVYYKCMLENVAQFFTLDIY